MHKKARSKIFKVMKIDQEYKNNKYRMNHLYVTVLSLYIKLNYLVFHLGARK